VQNAWIVSTIAVKYFVFGVVLISLRENEGFQGFTDRILEYSPGFVTLLVALGALNVFVGAVEEPFFKVFSEIVAFSYFLYLFWKY